MHSGTAGVELEPCLLQFACPAGRQVAGLATAQMAVLMNGRLMLQCLAVDTRVSCCK